MCCLSHPIPSHPSCLPRLVPYLPTPFRPIPSSSGRSSRPVRLVLFCPVPSRTVRPVQPFPSRPVPSVRNVSSRLIPSIHPVLSRPSIPSRHVLSFPSHPVPSILSAPSRPVPSHSVPSHYVLFRPFVPPRPSRPAPSRPVQSRPFTSCPVHPPSPVISYLSHPVISCLSHPDPSRLSCLSRPFLTPRPSRPVPSVGPPSLSPSHPLCLSPSPSLPHPLSHSSFRSLIGVGPGIATTARRPLRSNNSSPPHRAPDPCQYLSV